MAGEEAGGFGAEAVGAEAYSLVTVCVGKGELVRGEVAFGADEYAIGFSGGGLGEEMMWVLPVYIGDEFFIGLLLCYKIGERYRFCYFRARSFQRLLHGAEGDTLHPVGFEAGAFGVLAEDKAYFIDTRFYCLFDKPLHAVSMFGRRDGDMDVKGVWRFFSLLCNGEVAALFLYVGDYRIIE